MILVQPGNPAIMSSIFIMTRYLHRFVVFTKGIDKLYQECSIMWNAIKVYCYISWVCNTHIVHCYIFSVLTGLWYRWNIVGYWIYWLEIRICFFMSILFSLYSSSIFFCFASKYGCLSLFWPCQQIRWFIHFFAGIFGCFTSTFHFLYF